MSFKSVPSHVAILVPSVQKAADYLRKFEFSIGPAQDWDGEGTREIYVEVEKCNSLLLMEPTKPGAYQRALEKRGPGLHHLAIDVLNIEEYILSLSTSGWLLHPMSLHSLKHVNTAYLARPGFPGLIEVQQKKELAEGKPFVEELSLPLDPKSMGLTKSIGLDHIVKTSSGPTQMKAGGKAFKLSALWE